VTVLARNHGLLPDQQTRCGDEELHNTSNFRVWAIHRARLGCQTAPSCKAGIYSHVPLSPDSPGSKLRILTANLGIAEWLHTVGFDKKRAPAFMDQALIQLVLDRLQIGVSRIVVRHLSASRESPEQWINSDSTVMLRGAVTRGAEAKSAGERRLKQARI